MDCITLRDTVMDFGEKRVLKGISLSVKECEIFGLLGPSGAGKTTIIRILTGQLAATGGSASILGTDCVHIDDSIYAKIGMVLDTSGLYKRLSCQDNLSVFCEIYGVGKDCIPKILEQVGLGEQSRQAVSKLSKGQTQRLVLARALMHKPKLLFLDEPTSGLDPATARSIHNLIQAQREDGATVFLTTHNMTEAAELCDRIVLLNEGQIVEAGEPAALCRKYNDRQTIEILTKDGSRHSLPCTKAAAEQISALLKADNIASIHSSEPDLETVFLRLTGRKLV